MKISRFKARKIQKQAIDRAGVDLEARGRQDTFSPSQTAMFSAVIGGVAGLGVFLEDPTGGRLVQFLSGSMLGAGGGMAVSLLSTNRTERKAGRLLFGAGVLALGVAAGLCSNPLVGATVSAAGGAVTGLCVGARLVEFQRTRRSL